MAKQRKYETVTINDVVWEIRPKKASFQQEDGTKDSRVIGYAHVPHVDRKALDEKAAKKAISDWVASGVYTWPQVLDDLLYGSVLHQFSHILTTHNSSEGGEKYSHTKAAWKYKNAVNPDSYDTFEDYDAALRNAFEAEKAERLASGQSSWNADDHQVFPRDVR